MKKTLILLIVVIAGFGMVYLLLTSGLVRRDENVLPPEVKLTEYEKVLETTPVSVLVGTIVRTGEELVVDVPAILGVATPENSPRRTKMIAIIEGTRVLARAVKSSAELDRELREYTRKTSSLRGEPPLPYTIKTIDKVDLKVGDVVMIRAAAGVDVRDEKIIEAAEIIRENQ